MNSTNLRRKARQHSLNDKQIDKGEVKKNNKNTWPTHKELSDFEVFQAKVSHVHTQFRHYRYKKLKGWDPPCNFGKTDKMNTH